MKSKKLLLIVSLVLALTMSLGGTLAYLTDTDEAVNVMTLGNVEIVQHELQRALNPDDSSKKISYNNNGKIATGNELIPFVQGQALYPAYDSGDKANYTAKKANEEQFWWGPYVTADVSGNGSSNGLWDDKLVGALDKFIFVENTGESDVYYRTLIAFECPVGMEYSQASDKEFMMNVNLNERFKWENIGYIEVDNVRYLVMVATYQKALKAGTISRPSLLQVVMTHNATSEDMELLGPTYEILALTQAVQTTNFDTLFKAEGAGAVLDLAFDDVTANTATKWFGDVDTSIVENFGGVEYVTEGATGYIISKGGNYADQYKFSDGMSEVTKVVVGEGIITLGNRSLCKAPSITTVELPNSLVYIDASAFQKAGITAIEIPENVKYIRKMAFGACGNLETIVIKAKDITIGNYVARACAKLKDVYIHSDDITFETGSMYFTNKENGDASGITFYVKNQEIANKVYQAFSTSHSYGMLIKSLDGSTTFYNTLK